MGDSEKRIQKMRTETRKFNTVLNSQASRTIF